MTWLQRYRLASFLRSSVWLPPVLGMGVALLLRPIIERMDATLGWPAAVGPDGARAVLGALASSMLTFIVFVFSILLVAMQLASAQLSPRIIAIVYRGPVLRLSLTFFVFTFTYTLAVMGRIEGTVPQLSMWVAVYSNVICIGLFIFMIDRTGKFLRPVAVLTRVGNEGEGVVRDVYPRPISGNAEAQGQVPLSPGDGLAARQLDTGRVDDGAGQLRLLYRTPDWDDFVSLSVTEIRQFGRESIQIVRRMRAMLENLIAIVPPQRVALLRTELDLLSRGDGRDFRDPEDQVRAAHADSLGVGGAG